MREFALWATALSFLLTAIFTVTVRREAYEMGRGNGNLEERLLELRRRNDNAALRRERLASPAEVLRRAGEAGITAPIDGGAGR